MGEQLQRESSAVAHRPRYWARRALVVVPLVLAGALGARSVIRQAREPDCELASRTASDGVVVLTCQREYTETRRPVTGARLADALRRSGELTAAAAIANELLATDARGTAQQVLGKIAAAQDRSDQAIRLLEDARLFHRGHGDHLELAKDDQALARILYEGQRYSDALQTLDECLSEARVADDARIEGFCHLTASMVLMYAGYFDRSQEELDRAEPQLSADRDLAQLWLTRGNYLQEAGADPHRGPLHKPAIEAFRRSLEIATRAQLTGLLTSVHLNLAYSLAESGSTDEADRHLAEAGVLDRDRRFESDRAQLAARIAYRRNNFELAFSLNEKWYTKAKDLDEQIEICVMQARIALARNDFAVAEDWARRGIKLAEDVRESQPSVELRPWVLSFRREPFELLFSALARVGRVDDAIAVFDQWQCRTLLDEMAQPSPDRSPGLSHAAVLLQSVGRWLPAASKAALMSIDKQAARSALDRIDLVALAVAEGDLWRITGTRGKLRIDDLGPVAKLRDRLDAFASKPTDRDLGDEVGALLLPDEVVRTTDEPLYVVLDAQVVPSAALPVVALRRNHRALIAVRPVVRSPRIPVIGDCPAQVETGRARVLGDASGDLPEARLESSTVAALLGTTPLVGEAATSAALFAARSDALLHVAVHAAVDAGGGSLRLHDRAVFALEISANKLGPPLVVLSGCGTGTSTDPDLAGSLSTAFLAGGARRVIATLRPVYDHGARDLTTRFYEARGAEDPINALAKIQAALAATDDKDWPNFAVFSNQVCAPPP